MNLLQDVHAFLERSGIGRTEFSKTMAGDSGFLSKWETGKLKVGMRMQTRIRLWLQDNRHLVNDRPNARQARPSGTCINVANNPDLWEKDAEIASAMLLTAILRHHPERCQA